MVPYDIRMQYLQLTRPSFLCRIALLESVAETLLMCHVWGCCGGDGACASPGHAGCAQAQDRTMLGPRSAHVQALGVFSPAQTILGPSCCSEWSPGDAQIQVEGMLGLRP